MIFILNACSNDERKNKAGKGLSGIFTRLQYIPDSLDLFMVERFSESHYLGLYCDDAFRQYDSLKSYYSRNQFKSIWIKDFKHPREVDDILKIISQAGNHGLESSWYHYGLLVEFRNRLQTCLDSNWMVDHGFLADFELVLSDAVLEYSLHMLRGVINPIDLYSNDYLLTGNTVAAESYFAALDQKHCANYLRTLSPDDHRYTALMHALEELKQIKSQGAWDSIPWGDVDPKFKIEPGDTSQLIPLVIERLKWSGFLDREFYSDSVQVVFDSTISQAVARFQSAYGLYSDGVIGKRSIDEMNVLVDDRIWQVRLSLERFRWMSYPQQGRYAMVNIPEFMLYAVTDGFTTDTMKVCVGTKREKGYWEKLERAIEAGKTSMRPKDMETPCLQSRFSYIVLNPNWNIPHSIAKDEIFWKLLKNPTYLQEENIRVYLDGNLIDPDTINWMKYLTRPLPFQFRQDPGTFNSLGIIKFIFDNKFSIYLHDTPNKKAFAGSMRAVSHGCVRLEAPLALARFLLADIPEWNMDKLRVELGLAPGDDADTALVRRYKDVSMEREVLRQLKSPIKSRRINIEEIVGLYIDYYTCWVDGNGLVQFRPDVYRKDEMLRNALQKYRFPIPVVEEGV